MARIRTIKPQFFLNDEIAALNPLDRILFIGLWTLADRAGRLEDRPTRIKVQILPYDEHGIDEALNRLVAAKFILRYESGGEKYIEIINFIKHQHCHIKEPESTLPAPVKHGAKPVRKRQEGKGKEQEGKGREEEVGGPESPAFTLPEWIPKEVWAGYEEMRKAKKKPPTDLARDLVVKELESLKAKGHDPTACLEQSIRNGWTDVYELKNGGKANANSRDNRSFFERDVEQRKQAKQGARSLLGVLGGGARVATDPDPPKTDRQGAGAISGEVVCLPEVETS